MRRNQIFVTTGFQLLNALEYLQTTKRVGDHNTIIAIHSYPGSVKGIKELVRMHHWDNNVVYFFPKWMIDIRHKLLKQFLMNFWAFLKIPFILDSSSTIILGSYHNFICQVVAKKAHHNEIVLLDDGSSSIAYPDYVVSKNRIIEQIFGLSKFKIVPNYFFTAYYDILKSKLTGNTSLLKNNYQYLKSKTCSKSINSTIYFIGAPLVEEGFLSSNEYIDKIKSIYQKYNFVYVPHPRESSENICFVSTIADVLSIDIPFEIFLVSQQCLPELIIGFHSSIFFNVHMLFDRGIKTHYIKLTNIKDQDFRNRLLRLYEKLDLVSSELVL